MKSKVMFWCAAFAAVAIPAWAHTGVGATHGIFAGLEHPISGLDHILAMVAVGIWAAQLGGRALWAVPLGFVSFMVVGALVGMLGVNIPYIELGIAGSVVILGFLIFGAARFPLIVSVLMVAVFASFHGFAHGTEMPADASGLAYGAGFALATVLLHAAGIGFVFLMKKILAANNSRAFSVVSRLAGAVIAAAGVYLLTSSFLA